MTMTMFPTQPLRRVMLRAAGATGLACMAPMALSQDYPARTVNLLHGFAPGGNTDVIARLLAGELAKGLGQATVVDSKPGAGGNIAANMVAKAVPDGYTLLVVTGGHATTGPLHKSLPFRPIEDFEWVSLVTTFPFVFVARSNGKYLNIAALVAAAKASPGSVSFGTPGIGATPHLIGELLGSLARVQFLHVPYKGESAAITALLGGEIDFVVTAPAAALPHIKSGRMSAIAVSGGTRWRGMPEVPAVQEAGIADFDVKSWAALAAPAGTPRAVVMRLNAELMKVLKLPQVRSQLEAIGGDVQGSSPEEMRARMAADVQRWTRVIRDANIPLI